MRTVKDEETLKTLAATRGNRVDGKDGPFNVAKKIFVPPKKQEPKKEPEPEPEPKVDFSALGEVITKGNLEVAKILSSAIKSRPRKWTFKVRRDKDGLMESVEAEAE